MADFRSIDAAFTQAVETKAMPGIVAMAANDKGVIYEGAFGKRDLSTNTPMTRDSVVWIASMTKAITAAAAMQLVEQGKLSLEQPAGATVPELESAQVLEGFDAGGKPILRPPKRPITLRHLLTHTAGFSYEIWSPEIARYQTETGTPGITTCTNAALTTPLLFDPGDRWDYGINIDWAGKMVEAASGDQSRPLPQGQSPPAARHARHVVQDLSVPAPPAGAHSPAGRQGRAHPVDLEIPQEPEFFMGGGGLYGTAGDYLSFTRMILQGGTLNGTQVLRRETVDLMAQNHMGPLEVGPLKTAMPALSNDVELFPGMSKKWGLSFLINTQDAPGGRSAGSLAWAGLANTYFWIDRTRNVTGVFLSQVLPFFDETALGLFGKLEAEVYLGLER